MNEHEGCINVHAVTNGILAKIDTVGPFTNWCYALEGRCHNDSGIHNYGVYGFVDNAWQSAYGVRGYATGGEDENYGVKGTASGGKGYRYGLHAEASGTDSCYGVYGARNNSVQDYAVYSYGNLHVTGTSTKGGGGFRIDHPQDPENMYLSHSDVSSPDMKNIYDGVVKLDADGEAVVELPPYFDALNENFRYQLTPIGASMPGLYIAQKMEKNRFIIAGGKPFTEVSWMVTGIRKDNLAKSKSIAVETLKDTDKQGRYQNPELFGYGIEKSVDYEHLQNNPEAEEQFNE
jgi:hypothetical protein